MKFNKKILDTNEKVYATCIGEHNGSNVYIGCSEGVGAANAFIDGKKSNIWNEPGGTMSFIPVPGRKDTYLATQKFLPVFAAAECTVNLVTYCDGNWETKEIMKFPYLHRFELFTVNNEVYFFGATLCESKEFQKDWSKPGSLYVGKLNDDLSKAFEVKEIYKGITKNHGLWKAMNIGSLGCFFVGGEEGGFKIEIPNSPMTDEWTIEKIIDGGVSDMAVADVDGDGKLELATIEEFHGEHCRIYKEENGKYVQVQEFTMDFGHVIWGGKLGKQDHFLLGYRRADMKLLCISYENGEYVSSIVDEQTGPSQITVKTVGDKSIILSANRQINQLALYEVED